MHTYVYIYIYLYMYICICVVQYLIQQREVEGFTLYLQNHVRMHYMHVHTYVSTLYLQNHVHMHYTHVHTYVSTLSRSEESRLSLYIR